jgi:hypothetical protein
MKTNLLLALAVIGITSVSCRKERTCECKDNTTTVTSTPTGGTTTALATTSYKIVKEKQYAGDFRSQTDCYSQQYTDISNSGKTQTTHDISCDIK